MLRLVDRPRTAVQIARSICVAFLALVTVVLLGVASTMSSAAQLLASTALIMSGTFTPTPPPAFVEMAKNNFIVPTHPGEDIGPYVAVTTPEQAWPVTGLSDYPFGTSVAIGLGDLEQAMAAHGNDNLIIFGHSQSSVISYLEKRRLAEEFPIGTAAPNIDFVTIGTLNLPNGGVMTRFWGLYLPLVDFYFNGPAPTDTQFDTVIITQRWDGFADFPIYPINVLAVLNAVAGFFYVHEEYAEVTLAGDPSKYLQGTHGDTDYYFFETENLPIFGPLRSIGVPEPLIDIVEPLTTFVVELGYRRDIPPWVPTPARLIPIHDPFRVVDDFFEAVDETITNAGALVGSAPPVAIPAPADIAAMSATTSVPDQDVTDTAEPTPQPEPEHEALATPPRPDAVPAVTETEKVTRIDGATHTASTSKKDKAAEPLAVASADEPGKRAVATQVPKTHADREDSDSSSSDSSTDSSTGGAGGS